MGGGGRGGGGRSGEEIRGEQKREGERGGLLPPLLTSNHLIHSWRQQC